jgi:hypothetical protein
LLAWRNSDDGSGEVLHDVGAKGSGVGRDTVEQLLPGPSEDAVEVAGGIGG